MGCYINPPDISKEEWLENNAKPIKLIELCGGNVPAYSTYPKGTLPVVAVDNGRFTAAGVCYCEEEYKAFTQHPDIRPRALLQANISDLMKVSDLKEYL